jgi:lysophospholipase L1-like esterase
MGQALGQALAQDRPAAVAASCMVQADLARFEQPLTHVARRLAAGMPVKIVAIGSSSTAGFGASSPANTYPSRLEAELRQYFPGHPITVVNRGVNSEEISNMLLLFESAVVAERPQLVIWQFGSNALMHDQPVDPGLVAAGIARLKAIGADVVLMDPQYAPRVLAKPAHERVVALFARAAKENGVDLLRRFDVMRHWHEVEGLPFETYAIWDGLHLNDWGYACVAKTLAAAITEATSRPMAELAATAGAPTKLATTTGRNGQGRRAR